MNIKQKEQMAGLFKKADLQLSDKQLKQFAVFYDMLTQNNEEFDLTRLHSFEDIVIKHFIDSVYFTKYIELPASLLDIGTGPGFPGIPLKIMNPKLRLILAEPKNRRVTFLHMVVDELTLSDTEIYPHMVTEKSFFTTDGVITRALESVNDTLIRVKHFLPQGGKVLFMKGPNAVQDIDAIDETNKRDFQADDDIDYTLPNTSYRRRILAFTKTSSVTKHTYRILKNENETPGVAITSSENKLFKELKKLTTSAGIKKSGSFLISGKKIVSEVLASQTLTREYLIISDGYSEDDEAMNAYIGKFKAERKLLILKRSLYNELDLFSTDGPILSAVLPEIEQWQKPKEPGCYMLIPFQDPQNVGAVIRSAAGFGATGVIMLREAALPFHPKAIRSSSGAVFNISLYDGPSINDVLDNKEEIPIIALDSSGRSINDFTFPETFYLLPGLEGPGLPEKAKKNAVSIPLERNIESLNGSIAAAIALFEWKRQKRDNK